MKRQPLRKVGRPQRVGDLTVQKMTVNYGAGLKVWWVWRDSAGRQVHAGMDSRQYLPGGRTYELRAGKWRVLP